MLFSLFYIENEIINKSKQIQEISEERDILYDIEQKLLDDAQKDEGKQ